MTSMTNPINPVVHYTHDDLMDAFQKGLLFGQNAVIGKAPGYAQGYVDGAAERMLADQPPAAVETVERQALLRCPDWCVSDHSGDLRDAFNNLVTHEAAPHAYGIRVMRTDCPDEGRTGEPVLYVRVELELTTWEEAGRLAHTVLEGIDYLAGADQD